MASAEKLNQSTGVKRKMWHTRELEGQNVDEISITTVPRYKTSKASGDEWRFSCKVDFKKNGIVVRQEHYGNIMNALPELRAVCRDVDLDASILDGGYCDQEGCSKRTTKFYRVKNFYCRSCGKPDEYQYKTQAYVCFCERHSTRGDCGLFDSDSNYLPLDRNPIDGSLIIEKSPVVPCEKDISKSSTNILTAVSPPL